MSVKVGHPCLSAWTEALPTNWRHYRASVSNAVIGWRKSQWSIRLGNSFASCFTHCVFLANSSKREVASISISKN